MHALLLSSLLVFLAEMGDKTQLLAFLLAARFRQPLPIIAGIFVATALNHAAAGVVGMWLTQVVGPDAMRWILGLSFIAMAAWILVPDEMDDQESQKEHRFGVFGATVIAYFLAEMGDKTQIATVALGARFPGELVWVVAETTLGMMLANAPAVYLGNRFAEKLPIRLIHGVCAVIFALIGVFILWGKTGLL